MPSKKTKKVRVFIFDKPRLKKSGLAISGVGYMDNRNELYIDKGETCQTCFSDLLSHHVKPYQELQIEIKISPI